MCYRRKIWGFLFMSTCIVHYVLVSCFSTLYIIYWNDIFWFRCPYYVFVFLFFCFLFFCFFFSGFFLLHLQPLSRSLNADVPEQLITPLVSLGHISMLAPDQFASPMKSIVANFIVKDLLMNDRVCVDQTNILKQKYDIMHI